MLIHKFFSYLFRSLVCCFSLCISENSLAQIGGSHTYEFLNLLTSARTASLGGNTISIKDNDLNLAYQNPSLLDSSMNKELALNIINYFAGIKYGDVSYAMNSKEKGTYSVAIHFVRYGDFPETYSNGDLSGKTFTGGEYAFNLGWGKQLNNINEWGLSKKLDSLFFIGANVKFIYSSLADYYSFGIAADIAATYYNPKQQFTTALVVKNFGRMFKTYIKDSVEPLPFEIQIGISQKLDKAPLRFSIVAQHLEKWDLTYNNPNNTNVSLDPATNQPISQSEDFWNSTKKYADKVMRHVVLGGEVLITKNFNLRFGYNYQKRKELGVTTKMAMAGFSGGFGFKISKFRLSYGMAIYSLAGTSHYFSVSTNLSEFYSQKK